MFLQNFVQGNPSYRLPANPIYQYEDAALAHNWTQHFLKSSPLSAAFLENLTTECGISWKKRGIIEYSKCCGIPQTRTKTQHFTTLKSSDNIFLKFKYKHTISLAFKLGIRQLHINVASLTDQNKRGTYTK